MEAMPWPGGPFWLDHYFIIRDLGERLQQKTRRGMGHLQ